MKQYILIEIRVDILIAIFAVLFASIIFYYISFLLKRLLLKVCGFKYIENQGLKAPKKFQARYIKDSRNIRARVVDNISIIKLVIWLRRGEE